MAGSSPVLVISTKSSYGTPASTESGCDTFTVNVGGPFTSTSVSALPLKGMGSVIPGPVTVPPKFTLTS